MARLLKPGGRIGVVVPSLREELDGDEPPAHLREHWDPGSRAFPSPVWWRRNWTRTGAVSVETADRLEDGRRDWPVWSEVCAEESPSEFTAGMARESVAPLNADRGRLLGFARVVGRRG